MGIEVWANTANNNGTVDSSINIAEGCPPSGINNAIRQVMADVRTQLENSEWFNYGLTISYVSNTQYSVPGNLTSVYKTNRRIQAVGTLTGTIYGTITASTYTGSATTVTVQWDNTYATGMQNETLTIYHGIISSVSLPPAYSGSGYDQTFTGDGVTTSFTLTTPPVSNTNLTTVVVGGVKQQVSSYAINGTTLSFTQAPPAGTVIEIQYVAVSATGVPSASSVTTSTLTPNLSLSGLTVLGVDQANNIIINGSSSGSSPTITANGTDTNVGIISKSKGTGLLTFGSTNGTALSISAPTASTVNGLSIAGSPTGSAVVVSTLGSDANINLNHITSGYGSHNFYSNATTQLLSLVGTTSAVNYLNISAASTGLNPTISATGTDTNISLSLNPKGTGVVAIGSYATVTTPSYPDNTTKVASTAYVTNAIAAVGTTLISSIVVNVTSSYSVTNGNKYNNLVVKGSYTVTLPQSSTLVNGWYANIEAQGGVVTLAPYGTDNINSNGASTSVVLPQGTSTQVTTDAAGNWWFTVGNASTNSANPVVRQTVLIGDNANGNASFINTGTGLTPAYTASTQPLTITYANGFGQAGPVDYIARLSSGGNTATCSTNVLNYIYTNYVNPTSATWGNTLAPVQYGATYNKVQQVLLQLNNNGLDDNGNAWSWAGTASYSNTSPKIAGTYYATFNGTNQGISTTSVNSISTFGNGGWTVEGYFNMSTTGTVLAPIFGVTNASGFGLIVDAVASTNYLELRASSSGSSSDILNLTSSVALTTGAWHHIACVNDPVSGYIYVYLDGVMIPSASGITSGKTICPVTSMFVGGGNCLGTTRYFTGSAQCVSFRPYCAYPSGTTFTPFTAAPSITTTGYASDWFDTTNQVLKTVSSASTTAGVNPSFTSNLRTYVGEAAAGASTISSVNNYPFNISGKNGAAFVKEWGYANQSWQNVSASRAFGTTYYNPTNRPILVSLGVADATVATFNLTVNGVVASSASINNYANGNQIMPLTAIVPPGGNYIVTASVGTGLINTWAELR